MDFPFCRSASSIRLILRFFLCYGRKGLQGHLSHQEHGPDRHRDRSSMPCVTRPCTFSALFAYCGCSPPVSYLLSFVSPRRPHDNWFSSLAGLSMFVCLPMSRLFLSQVFFLCLSFPLSYALSCRSSKRCMHFSHSRHCSACASKSAWFVVCGLT